MNLDSVMDPGSAAVGRSRGAATVGGGRMLRTTDEEHRRLHRRPLNQSRVSLACEGGASFSDSRRLAGTLIYLVPPLFSCSLHLCHSISDHFPCSNLNSFPFPHPHMHHTCRNLHGTTILAFLNQVKITDQIIYNHHLENVLGLPFKRFS